MGTTLMFRLAAEDPVYVRKNVSTFIAIGPIIVPTSSASVLIKALVKTQKSLYKFL